MNGRTLTSHHGCTMRPDSDDILKAISWTFENRIVPALPDSDELAQSYARTMSFMLGQLADRLAHEPGAMREDWADLRGLLAELSPQLSGGLRQSIDEALGEADVAQLVTSGTLTKAVTGLRGLLIAAMQELPATQRDRVREYLGRHLEREGRFLKPSEEARPF